MVFFPSSLTVCIFLSLFLYIVEQGIACSTQHTTCRQTFVLDCEIQMKSDTAILCSCIYIHREQSTSQGGLLVLPSLGKFDS